MENLAELLSEAIEKQDIELVELLLDKGADIEAKDNEGTTLLSYAIYTSNLELTKLFLDRGANIEAKDNEGITPLFYAIYNSSLELTKLLLDRGANINAKDNEGYTPLLDYIEQNEEKFLGVIEANTFDIVKLLLEYGADVNYIHDDTTIFTRMVIFTDIKLIQLALDYGANVNPVLTSENTMTPLIFILFIGSEFGYEYMKKHHPEKYLEKLGKNKDETLRLLIKNGADVNVLIEGMPILFMASLVGDLEIVELLLQNGANPNVKLGGKSLFGMLLMMTEKLFELMTFDMKEDMGTLFSNFEKNKFDIAKLFIKYGVDINKERLHDMPLLGFCTISQDSFSKRIEELKELNIEDREKSLRLMNSMNFGDIEVAKFLIEHGADVNIKYDDGNTFVYDACLMNNIPMVKLLCENEADVNQINEFGETILFHACSKNKVELVQILLDLGADVNTKSSSGFKNTALGVACQKENIEIVKLLIDAGVDVNANILGSSLCNAYSYGQNNREIKKLLLKNGINTDVEKLSTNKRDKSEEKKEIKKLSKEREQRKLQLKQLELQHKQLKLKMKQKSILSYKSLQKTPITEILKSKDTEALKRLLNKGYDVQYVDIISLLKEDYPLEFIELIVFENSKDINIQDKDGNTALMVASKMDNLDIVSMLLKYNPNVNIKNKNDEEAWELTDNDEVRNRLLDFEDEIILNQPNKLVKLLTNFTIDTPIKYTTHEWRKRIDEKYFDDFDLFLNDVNKQFNSIGDELNELSPNLYKKIEYFICSKENPNSWKSMQNLKHWIEDKKEPFDFLLSENNMPFKEIIENFKNQIEIRGNNLQDIFLEHKQRLGREFKINISDNLKGEKFYTDVEKFQETIDEIFKEIEKYAKEQDNYRIDIELYKPEKEFIELHIIHIDSVSGRSAEDLLERIKLEEGDSVLRPKLKNLCDWHIEASYKEESFSIDCFKEQTEKIEKPKGFTHIMRFYK